MIGFTAERVTWIDVGSDQVFVEDVRAILGKSLAPAASQLAEYVRVNKLSGQSLNIGRDRRLNSRGWHIRGTTRDSVRPYRMKDRHGNDLPRYMVRPGVGIWGSLNYLSGMTKGVAVSKLGNGFRYIRPRPFMDEAWKEWGAGKKLRSIGESVQSAWLRERASRAPQTETIGGQ
jgi:hypothetical protein